MKTIDIVMPTGGSQGGVEYVINAWTKSLISERYDLRIIHITPGSRDYLEGYEKQWTMPCTGEDSFDIEFCAKRYEWFIRKYGIPDLCIAAWIPMMVSACRAVCDTMGLKFKIISWLHSGIDVYKQTGWGGIEHLAFADYHFCISSKNRDDILSAYPDAKTFLTGNPIRPVDVQDYSPDERTLCFVGRITPEKRLDVILNAISLARDISWKLLVAGTGERMEAMIELCQRLDIEDRIRFLGWQDDPWFAVKEASILLIASDYEGFSISALEASGMGMTDISTPVSGCTDYITSGINGYFFDNENPQNLADILDCISEGKLSICKTEDCIKSVVPYMWERYFERVDEYLQCCLEK